MGANWLAASCIRALRRSLTVDTSSASPICVQAGDMWEPAPAWWLKALGPRAKRWRPYWGDTNTMLQADMDLCTRVREGIGGESRWWRDVACWTEERRVRWAERACIMELDGSLSRDEAERQAFALLAERAG